jgi:hypothetical protein
VARKSSGNLKKSICTDDKHSMFIKIRDLLINSHHVHSIDKRKLQYRLFDGGHGIVMLTVQEEANIIATLSGENMLIDADDEYHWVPEDM